jgi:DNA-binding GntR family transcriptional regulator
MISPQGRDDDRGPGLAEGEATGAADERSAIAVLADRVAAALVHHEPGWRLPRRSALARRYGVSPAEMESAIEELAARHLLRRLPDGQVYRASPADYLIRLEGLPDLQASIDPMGTAVICTSRHVSMRRVPEDIGGALGLPLGDPVCVVRCLWTSGGDPAAFSATYLPESHTFLADDPPAFSDVLKSPRVLRSGLADGARSNGLTADGRAEAAEPAEGAQPAGLYVELQPPAPSVARSLRLAAGQPAVNVTVRFDSPAGSPVALSTAVLRPDMFRVVVESPQAPPAMTFSGEDDFLVQNT